MKLVILDRDGVINKDSPEFIKSAREWQPIEGSLEAIARLTHAGFRVVVASNQSGIGRGLFAYDELFAIHDKMNRMVAELGGRLDGVFFCPHSPDDSCECRKPETGLYRDIGRRLQVELTEVPIIGDGWRDIVAARAVGGRPVLVRTGNGMETEQLHADELNDVSVHENLASAAVELVGNAQT